MTRTLFFLTLLSTSLIGMAQNTCQNAQLITASTYVINVVGGSQPPTLLCTAGSPATAAEWYSYTPTADRSLTVTTDLPVNQGRDTRFHVYTGGCDALVCVAGDDDSGTELLSTATFNVFAGITYLIAFDNAWESNGFVFRLTEMTPAVEGLSFTPRALPTNGMVMCVVDMNGDFLDDAIRVTANTIHVFRQETNGAFTHVPITTPLAAHTPSWSIAAGDIDNNGYNDLLYGGGQGTTFMIANADGTGFTQITGPEYVFSQRTNFIDINNDGHLDAFVCHDVEANVYYMNNGNGGLTFNQGGLGDTPEGGNYGSIWVDYDNDGDMDLFIAKCRGGTGPANINQMHRNNGDGTYTEVAAQLGLDDNIQTWSSAWGDFDNDGDMDVMVGASSNVNGLHKLLRNDGNGVFTNVTAGSGLDTFSALNVEHITHDFDNDGWLDIFSGGNVIWMNNGDMTFSPTTVPMNNGPVGDLNNDGFLDIVSLNTVYLNDGNENNWIKFNLIGTNSNRNGIGARITITSAMGNQIREVRSGDGFAFMSSLNPHFGLGTDQMVTQAVIRWPSGTLDTLMNLQANTTNSIVEGTSGTVGMNASDRLDVRVYPSPAAETIHIQGVTGNATVQVMDMAGRLVIATRLAAGQLDVSGLRTGLYRINITTEDGIVVKRGFSKL